MTMRRQSFLDCRRTRTKKFCFTLPLLGCFWIIIMMRFLQRLRPGSSFSLRAVGLHRMRYERKQTRTRLVASRRHPFQNNDDDKDNKGNSNPTTYKQKRSITSVGIIGGGLAGLSTAYHLLQKQPTLDITILDVAAGPGQGGASSVAGG